MARSISANFLADLQNGVLAPLRERVLIDHTVALELRGACVIFYYRGAKLIEVGPSARGYKTSYDEHYIPEGGSTPLSVQSIATPEDAREVVRAWPLLKEQIDLFLGRYPKEEREIQQQLVRDNNWGAVANATDHFICDIEYANAQGRFDFIGVNWPSTSEARRRTRKHRLVVGEVKYGDGALKGRAGLHEHIGAANKFLSNHENVRALKDEMRDVFNQKRRLGLIGSGNELSEFSDDLPLLLLVIANHDPAKTNLRELLDALPACPYAEIRFASSSLFGYGLYDQALLTPDRARSLLAGWHNSPREVAHA